MMGSTDCDMEHLSPAELLRRYDLTKTHGRYMDKHMYVYLLGHLRKANPEIKAYSDDQLFQSELQLLQKTKMADHYLEQYAEYKGSTDDAEVVQQREKVEKEMDAFREKCQETMKAAQKFLDIFYPDEDLERGFEAFTALAPDQSEGADKKTLFNLEHLQQQYGITKNHFEALYQFAKLRYEAGQYPEAQMFLHYYTSMSELDHSMEARWGKLAADTLVNDWGSALDTIKAIQDNIDKGVPVQYATPGAQLQARAWLMHWSLFVFFYFNNDDGVMCDEGLDKLVQMWLPDMYSQEKEGSGSHRYLRVLQTICPHLVRYLVVAVIVGQEKTGKRAGQESGHIKMKQRNKDLTRLIESEKAYYSDPITCFVRKLLSDCDLEGAHAVLPQCELVMDSDFFLHKHKERFVRQAREMIFENYCRIHSVMDIGMVARKLGQDTAEAECYIVKMIRGAQLDAKIDSEANQVLLASQGSTFYRNIREKTKLVRDKTDQLIERLQDRRPHDDPSKADEKKDDEAQRPSSQPAAQPAQREQRPTQPRSSMKDFSRD